MIISSIIVEVITRKFSPMKSINRFLNKFSTSSHKNSIVNPSKFWRQHARKIDWFDQYREILSDYTFTTDKDCHHNQWFLGGVLNTCFNCLDRHILRKDFDNEKTAIIYDSPVTSKISKISYSELLHDTIRLASLMKAYGLKKGDRVVIYMPNIPESGY